MGKRAAVEGWPFALVHVYAANTHQPIHPYRFHIVSCCVIIYEIFNRKLR